MSFVPVGFNLRVSVVGREGQSKDGVGNNYIPDTTIVLGVLGSSNLSGVLRLYVSKENKNFPEETIVYITYK